jgi:hypothetical protein
VKVNEFIEILEKVKEKDLDIILYDDELDDYIKIDSDCIEFSDDVEICFYKQDRQGSEIKHSGEINYIKVLENNENVYYYVCPFCKHQHKIINENYSYKFFENNEEIQETCDNCGKSLFLS